MSNINLECLIGLRCNDFAMLAADQTNVNGIIVMKDDEEKLHKISDSLVLGVNGDAGDAAQFAQYVAKNIQLYRMRNQYPLGTEAVVHFTRRNLADGLRSGTPFMVNMVFAGYEPSEGGQLYYMDFLGTSVKVPYAVHSFGGILSMSILERYHKPTMTEQEAYQVLQLCVNEVHRRLFIKLPRFQVCLVNKQGIKPMPNINVMAVGGK